MMDFDALVEVKSGLGTAAVIVMDKSVSSLVAPPTNLIGFKMNKSTGRRHPMHSKTDKVLSP